MAEQPRPVPGEVQDGYRYMGGDPSDEKSWFPVDKPQLPEPPPESFGTKAASLAYRAGKAFPGLAREAAPYVAATGATIADPIAAPITAPLAYASTQGLVNPKEIQQHPIREGLMAASMAIPSPAEAVGRAFPKLAYEHPVALRGLGALGGALVGGTLGEEGGSKIGYGPYGGAGGAIGGALVGYGMGGRLATAEGEQLVRDAFAGKRSLSDLPPELADKARGLIIRSAKRAAELAQMTGQKVDTMNLPSTVTSTAEQMVETRMRRVPNLPGGIVSPEEAAAEKQAANYWQSVKGRMEPEGSAIGSAHQTYRHSPEEVLAKRGTRTIETRGFKVRPRMPLPIVPPE